MSYTILKSIHLISAIAWMAGLLYIGRIYVYWVEASSSDVKSTLAIMARRLQKGIILPSSIIATLIGLHLIGVIGAFSMGWFHLKLLFIILIFGYQHSCGRITKKIGNNTFDRSSRWCRIYNEVPIVLLTGVIFSVITKDVFATGIATALVMACIALYFFIKR